uniref:Serpentine receptor class gamma n=1 Tax=Heterorhabditis bacteriophora TaxID=37862 RepID=A0A1I7WCT2_HETBA
MRLLWAHLTLVIASVFTIPLYIIILITIAFKRNHTVFLTLTLSQGLIDLLAVFSYLTSSTLRKSQLINDLFWEYRYIIVFTVFQKANMSQAIKYEMQLFIQVGGLMFAFLLEFIYTIVQFVMSLEEEVHSCHSTVANLLSTFYGIPIVCKSLDDCFFNKSISSELWRCVKSRSTTSRVLISISRPSRSNIKK